jgi:hypothetical protein
MHTVPIKEAALSGGEEVTRSLIPWKEDVDKAMSIVDDKARCTAYQVGLHSGLGFND